MTSLVTLPFPVVEKAIRSPGSDAVSGEARDPVDELVGSLEKSHISPSKRDALIEMYVVIAFSFWST